MPDSFTGQGENSTIMQIIINISSFSGFKFLIKRSMQGIA
jgi:hypothetical protein